MGQREIQELAQIISSLPNYTEEHHISKYIVIERTAQWLEQRCPGFNTENFNQLCWSG